MSHYKPYPAYRDSGVEWIGRVPEHWKKMPFKRVATICNGRDYKEVENADGAYPVIGSGGEFARASDFMFEGESVLLGRKGTIDKPLYINGPFWAVDTMFYTKIADNAFPKFVYYNALTIPFGLYSTNTALPSMAGEDLSSHVIAAPEFEEQKAIAVGVDRETTRIDALITKKTRFIELLKEKRQALITHAVTKGLDPNVKMKDSGVEWIGEVPEHWVIGRLCDFCSSISTGPFGTALGVSDYIEDGIPVINPSHMNDGLCAPDRLVTVSDETAQRLAFWALREGDIVAARRGELGRAAIVTGKEAGWICGTGSLRLTPLPERAVPEYLYSVLQSDYARAWLDRESVGSTMPNLNESLIGRLPVVIPPSTTEQIALLSSLDQQECRVASLITKTQRSIDLLKERRAAFITAAVTGQIDLRESA